jgi:hypothetical protein
VVPRGRPKYVKGIVPTLQPMVFAKCKAFSTSVFQPFNANS